MAMKENENCSSRKLFGSGKISSKLTSKSLCFTPVGQTKTKEIDAKGLTPKDLFGAKLMSNDEWESPYGSAESSFSYDGAFNTPIQPEKYYQMTQETLKNEESNCPEAKEYIATFIKDDEMEKQFVNYQYDHNLFSPFNFYDNTPTREPLVNIPPFALQRKLAYTDWVKDNRKDFSFIYNDNKTKEGHKDHMLFSTFNNNDMDNSSTPYGICSPIIMPPSPIKSEKFEKPNGFKTLFKEENEQNNGNENIDTEWILDILAEEKESPEKPMEDSETNSSKDVSSKAHLKTLFNNSKFTTSKTTLGSKQVTVGTARRLDFGSSKFQSSSKKLSFMNENKKEECIEQKISNRKDSVLSSSNHSKHLFTPAPVKMLRKTLSDIVYDKETIMQVSRRLQDEINDSSPTTVNNYKNFNKEVKEWEKDGYALTMK